MNLSPDNPFADLFGGFGSSKLKAPDDLMEALWWQESRNKPNAVSPKGAMGIGQVMPGTAKDPGFGVQPLSDPFNPEENKRFSRDYMNAMLGEFGGDEEAALVAYNWGPGKAKRWVAGGKNPRALPAETRNYVQTIQATRGRIPQPQQPQPNVIEPGPQFMQAGMAPGPAAQPQTSNAISPDNPFADLVGGERVPSSGVTIAEKGAAPREATPAEAQEGTWRTASMWPVAANMENPGEWSFAVPQALKDAVTLPGDVYAGRVDPRSEEGAERAMGLATLAVPGAPGRVAIPGQGFVRPAPKVPRPAPRTTDEIKGAASAAYKQAEDAGLNVRGESWDRLVKGIIYKTTKEGIDRTIHPKATAALARLTQAQGPKTLQEIDTLRRVVGAAAKSIDPDERRIAVLMRDRIDDWLGNLGQRDVLAGDAKAASSSIVKARSLWATMRKAELVEDIWEGALNTLGANYSAAGMQTALRQAFKGLQKNKAKMRQFTKEEQAMIRRITRGASLENMLRWLGKFAPTGSVSGLTGAGTGFLAGGPAGAVALPIAGAAARSASARMGLGKFRQLDEMIRRGADDY